jgi:flagellar protein FlaG
MELEIHNAGSNPVRRYPPAGVQQAHAAQGQHHVLKQAAIVSHSKSSGSNFDPEQYIEDILRISRFFNRKLKFSINRELEQVVVKVIDSKTDKVIKEIPPEALQRLHQRMQEALGLLIDEEI